MNTKVLLVDDDPDILTLLQDRLESYGYSIATASDGAKALEALAQDPPELVLLDLEMPRVSGLDVLKTLGSSKPGTKTTPSPSELPIIVMTAHGTIAVAVEAMKFGAYDFVTKPFDMDHLSLVIGKALERESLKREVEYLRGEVESRYGKVIGSSPNFKAVLDGAQRTAKSDISVLLLGESGTGKELFARSLHQWRYSTSRFNDSRSKALLLNPTKVQEVSDVASAGEHMPHKSTYFFPKPLTGLVMNVMNEGGDEH